MLIDWSSEKKTDLIKENVLISRSSEDWKQSLNFMSHTHAAEITEIMVEVTQMFLQWHCKNSLVVLTTERLLAACMAYFGIRG